MNDVAQETTPDNPELTLEEGAIVFSEGERGRVAYSVIEGTVEIFRKGPDGKEIILSELNDGDLFGHMALIDEAPRSASARCKASTRLRVLDRKLLISQMGESPDLAMQIMHGLAGYVRNANEKVVASSLDHALDETDAERARQSEGSWLDRLLPWRNRTNQTIARFQPDALEIENRPFPAVARLTAYCIMLFIGAVIVWGSIARVETAISGRGVMAPTVANISVQATEPGIIRKLHVSEGQTVSAGDHLVTLDNTEVQANIDAATAQRDALEARLARLLTEFKSRMKPGPTPDFGEDGVENRMQQDIYLSRQAEFHSQVQSFTRRLESMQFRSTAIEEDVRLAVRQLGLLKELEAARRTLYRKQIGSKVQYLSTVFDRLSTQREVSTLKNSLEQLSADRKATDAEMSAYVSRWFSALAEEVVSSREELKKVEEQLVTLEQRRKNLAIRAATDAIVLDTHGFATGSVLRAAEQILSMVPSDTEMLVRLDIDAKDISRIKLGSQVSIKMDALPFQKHGEMIGAVEFISEDTFDETLLGQPGPVYRARVRINDNKLTGLPPDFRFIPGMNVTGDVVTGERRVITYFIYPIVRWLGTSLREP